MYYMEEVFAADTLILVGNRYKFDRGRQLKTNKRSNVKGN